MISKLFYVSLAINILGLSALFYVAYKAGGISYLFQKIKTVGEVPHNKARSDMFDQLPSVQGKTVFLGNSLTAGNEWHEMAGDKGVVNRGIPGDISAGILRRINQILDQKPEKLFLMIGINDLLNGKSKDAVFSNYKKIINIVAEYPETMFYIQSILPVNNTVTYYKDITNEDIEDLNMKIRDYALEQKVTFIDLYSSFYCEGQGLCNGLTYDGLHLTGRGYLVWYDNIKSYL